ncbi:MAG: segregation/condensation protein A [Candidatus Magasanikbacteria bacterium]|nr:segregation/condensation protein A [Candidatus Magasanikbacteria bacterium]
MPIDLKLEKFAGPLDLLLQLIGEDKLNITDVALAKVTEQYLAYLNTLEHERPDELADFLVVATRLVFMKSRELLPVLTPDEDEGISLAEQLKMYQKFVVASKVVLALWERKLLAYGRAEPLLRPAAFVLPANARAQNLRVAIGELLKRLKPVAPLPEVSIDKSITLRERIQKIFDFLRQWKKISFRELFKGAKNKTEIIVGFLALLELMKQDKIAISQPQAFSDMEIKHV